jgi:hypothetical protein
VCATASNRMARQPLMTLTGRAGRTRTWSRARGQAQPQVTTGGDVDVTPSLPATTRRQNRILTARYQGESVPGSSSEPGNRPWTRGSPGTEGIPGLQPGPKFGLYMAEPVCVPKTSSTSCDQAIFVGQAAGVSLFSGAVLVEVGRFGQRFQRRGAVQGAVRPVLVMVGLVLAQDPPRMVLVPDEGAVQELASASPIRRSAIAFLRGVAALQSTVRMPASARTAPNAAVKFDPRSRIMNLARCACSPRSMSRLRACWAVAAQITLSCWPRSTFH